MCVCSFFSLSLSTSQIGRHRPRMQQEVVSKCVCVCPWHLVLLIDAKTHTHRRWMEPLLFTTHILLIFVHQELCECAERGAVLLSSLPLDVLIVSTHTSTELVVVIFLITKICPYIKHRLCGTCGRVLRHDECSTFVVCLDALSLLWFVLSN